MIELQVELQRYNEARKPSSQSSCPATAHWSSNSSHCHQREIVFGGPAFPRRSAALKKDTFEFGTVCLREIEL